METIGRICHEHETMSQNVNRELNPKRHTPHRIIPNSHTTVLRLAMTALGPL